MPTSYNAESLTHTLAAAVAADPAVKAQLWDRELTIGAREADDFTALSGSEGSKKAIIVRQQASGRSGDLINMTVASDPRGPGAMGEGVLSGNESQMDFKTFRVRADIHRDAVVFTQKEIEHLAVDDVLTKGVNAIKVKLGRRRMNDLKLMFKLRGVNNTVFPNRVKSFDDLTGLDTMSPSFVSKSKTVWRRNGGMPFEINFNRSGSPVSSGLVYLSTVGSNAVRNSSTYSAAAESAAARGDVNPRFTGRMVPWQGSMFLEHETIDSPLNVQGDPFEPRALLGKAFSVDSALSAAKLIQIEADLKTRFFEYFNGYAKEWYQGQAAESAESAFYAAINAALGYAWIVNPDDTYGFVRWTGNANNGNLIQLDQILSPDGAGTTTIGSVTVGGIDCTGDTWDSTAAAGGVGSGNTSADYQYTDAFQVGASIIPCNANGVPDTCGLMLGVGAAIRYQIGSERMIKKTDDYGMVNGSGYQCTFGQTPCVDASGRTNGYTLMRFAGQHDGLEVPALNSL